MTGLTAASNKKDEQYEQLTIKELIDPLTGEQTEIGKKKAAPSGAATACQKTGMCSPGMHEGAAAPSSSIRRRGRVPRRGAIFCTLGKNKLDEVSVSTVLNP